MAVSATYWSEFGWLVIIILIQIDGLGVVAVAGAFAILSGRRSGLRQSSTILVLGTQRDIQKCFHI